MTELIACPQCNASIERWEITCHSCGSAVSSLTAPAIGEVNAAPGALQDSFQSWLDHGLSAYDQKDYDRASAYFSEALHRAVGTANAEENGLRARLYYAETLEKLEKFAESAQQFAEIAKVVSADKRSIYFNKAAELKGMAVNISFGSTNELYVPLANSEYRWVPLYCSRCKRLTNESEAFGFRKGLSSTVHCFCGFDGVPIGRLDSKHRRALQEAEQSRRRMDQLSSLAGGHFAEGKKKLPAVALAILFGDIGGHKFYLGRSGEGLLYLAFSWTFIPWIVSLYDVVHIVLMSQIAFNLEFNMDLVLANLPSSKPTPARDDLFSMEITEDPEDFVDDLTGPVPPEPGQR